MAQPIYGCLLFLSVACGTFSEAEQGEQRTSARRKKPPAVLFCNGWIPHKLFVSDPTKDNF